MFPANLVAGTNDSVRVATLYVTAPVIAVPPVVVRTTKAAAVSDAAFMVSLNVAVSVDAGSTFAAPLAGKVAVTVGGTTSAPIAVNCDVNGAASGFPD